MTNHNNNDVSLRSFFTHFFGACLIMVALTMRLLELPHLRQHHELLEIFASDFFFFGGVIFILGLKSLVKILSTIKLALSIFTTEIRNIGLALQEDMRNLLTIEMAAQPTQKESE